jgi:hypothetical protein
MDSAMISNRHQMERIADEALRYGDPRSPEYRLGVIDCLCRRTIGHAAPLPFRMGTCQADAYWAGYDRGWAVWNKIKAVQVESDVLADSNRGVECK